MSDELEPRRGLSQVVPIRPTVAAGARQSASDPFAGGVLEALAMKLATAIDAAEDTDTLDRLSRRLMELARMLGWGPTGVSADDRRPMAVLSDLGGPSLRNPKGSQPEDAGA